MLAVPLRAKCVPWHSGERVDRHMVDGGVQFAVLATSGSWTAVRDVRVEKVPVQFAAGTTSPNFTLIAIAFSRTHTGLNSANVGALIYTVRASDCGTSVNV